MTPEIPNTEAPETSLVPTDPTPAVTPTPGAKGLTAEQATKVEALLRTSPCTSFDLQRALFEGLNKDSAKAIKTHIATLLNDNRITAEGVKRGRKYSWV